VKKVALNKIITLDDVVARDQVRNVEAWILKKCEEGVRAKKISKGWDGKTVEGEPVLAFVNNGRWGARCKVCSNPMYVSVLTPVFYCAECGNGGSSAAWPVQFPAERESIEAELLKRELVVDESRLVRNEVELSFVATPMTPGLARNWRPGVSVEDLERERTEKVEGRKR
jgi:hypothetical protein